MLFAVWRVNIVNGQPRFYLCARAAQQEEVHDGIRSLPGSRSGLLDVRRL